MIKKILQICSILLLLTWSHFGISQSALDSNLQQIMVSRINYLAVKQKSIKLIDSLLQSKIIDRHDLLCQLEVTSNYIEGLNISENLEKYSAIEKQQHIRSILIGFDLSIDYCKQYKGKISSLKAQFLQDVNFKGAEYQRTMQILDSLRYKRVLKRKLNLAPTFMTSRNTQWLGLRLGIAAKKTIKVRNAKYTTNIVHALTAQYSKNLNKKGHEWVFSILDTDAPYVVQLFKFGYNHYVADNEANTKNRWFYRPEIGLNFHKFMVSFGYSIYFKEDVKDVDKAHLIVRYGF